MSNVSEKLPRGWAWTNLGEIATVIRGVTYEKADASDRPQDGLLPVLRATNIGERLNFSDLIYVPTKYIKEEQRLKVGDVIIAASSGSRQVVGKAAQLTSPWDGSFGAFCFALRSSPDVDSHYLALFLMTAQYRGRISLLSAGIGINNLRAEHLRSTPIPLAPLPEQARVVAETEQQLSRLDAAVASLQRVQANLKRYRAAVLKAACEGRLVPTEAELARAEGRGYEAAETLLRRFGLNPRERAGNLPAGWSSITLGEIAFDIQYGTSAKTSPDNTGVPVLRMGNIAQGNLQLDDLKFLPSSHSELPDLLLAPGDVLFNRTNSAELVGKTAVYKGTPTPCAFASYLIRVRLLECYHPSFLSNYINSPLGRMWVASVASQQVGQANVNSSKMRALVIPVPPLAEQERIVLEAERCLSLAEKLETALRVNLSRSKALRQAILRIAFTGKLTSQDPNDEPASVLLERIRQAKASQPAKPRARKEKTKPARAEESPPPTEPEPEPQKADFLELPRDEQVDLAWETLLGQGTLEKDAAIRTVADGLRSLDLARFKRLRQDGPLYGTIAAAIEKGVREGDFDRPRRGCVRAVLSDPKDYTDEVWQRCLLAVTGPEPADLDATLRAAAEWARDAMGLEYARLREDGVILTGLREALEVEVQAGRIVRQSGRVRRR